MLKSKTELLEELDKVYTTLNISNANEQRAKELLSDIKSFINKEKIVVRRKEQDEKQKNIDIEYAVTFDIIGGQWRGEKGRFFIKRNKKIKTAEDIVAVECEIASLLVKRNKQAFDEKHIIISSLIELEKE